MGGAETKKDLVDQGFTKKVVEHGENVGIDVETVERTPDDKELVPQARRPIVEQTKRDPGVLPVRDYEHRLYQLILTAPTHAGRPMYDRDLCQALYLQILPKNIRTVSYVVSRTRRL